MNCAEFEALNARSAGHCEACGIAAEQSASGRLVIDHDHRYGMGAVRGLICSSCNGLLGALEGGTSTGDAVTRRRLDDYLGRAWFMQIARWARLHGPQMDVPGEIGNLVEAILRSPAVRTLTEAAGQQPAVEITPVLMPGPLRYRADLTHRLAEKSAVEVRTVVLCTKKTASQVKSVILQHEGRLIHFSRATEAAAEMRKARKYFIAQMIESERQSLERRPAREARRIGKPIDPIAAEAGIGWPQMPEEEGT